MNKFGAIHADIPSPFAVWSDATGGDRSPSAHYPTMTWADLASLPVAEVAAEDCALFFWVTWPTLLEAVKVAEAWGFTYKTCAFDWVKRSKLDRAWHMGMGYWTRANTEPCLLFTRGKPKRVDKGVPQLLVDDDMLPLFDAIIAPVRRHSQKPEETYRRIEALMGSRVGLLDLFARENRERWVSIGNEIDGLDIRDALRNLMKEG